MKKKFRFSMLILAITCIQSCVQNPSVEEKEGIVVEDLNPFKKPTDQIDTTVLGDQEKNPYALENMRQAFAATGQSAKAQQLQPNRIYVKLNPTSRDQVYGFLNAENPKCFISEYPIDRKILTKGAVYLDAEAEDVILKPYYCVAFSKSDLPRIPYDVIAYGYVPTDDEVQVEMKAWEIAGYSLTKQSDSGNKVALVGYFPNGKVQVQNSQSPSYLNCRHKSIVASAFFKWSYMRTDANGAFQSGIKFFVPADLSIRYWNQEYRIYGHSLLDKIGVVKSSNQGTTFRISDSDKGAWHKANLNNTLQDYNDFANTIPTHRVNDAQFWVPISSLGSCSTIMMHHFGFYPHEISPADASASGHDFGVYRWNYTNYNGEREILFHEFSHWSHAISAGRNYWKKVCKGEGENVFNTLAPPNRLDYADPYRDGTQPTISVAANIGYAEAWAEFMGWVICTNYSVGSVNPLMENFEPQAIPHSYMNGGFNYNSWMPIGLFWDLWDSQNELNQKSINHGPVVRDCFTLPLPYLFSKLQGAESVKGFKTNILATTPVNERECMDQLFKAYGY